MKCQIRVVNPLTKESRVLPQVFENLSAAAKAGSPLAKSLKDRNTVRIEPANIGGWVDGE